MNRIYTASMKVCDFHSNMHKQRKQAGFTLMEVMIVVAIVGIISAVAYPSYMDQVRKSRRADAQIKLQEIAQLQESFFSRNMSYANNLSGLLGGSANTIDSDEGFYQVTISNAAGTGGAVCAGTRASPCSSYLVQAVPSTGTSQTKDSNCSRFTLNNMGQRGATDPTTTDTTARCW